MEKEISKRIELLKSQKIHDKYLTINQIVDIEQSIQRLEQLLEDLTRPF